MAELICPSCGRVAEPDDGPFCLNCVRSYVPRVPPRPVEPALETEALPSVPPSDDLPPDDLPSDDLPSDDLPVRQSASDAADCNDPDCNDPDCPSDGVVPQSRCRACGRSARRTRAWLGFPWGEVEIPPERPLPVGREESPLAGPLAPYPNVGRRHAELRRVGNQVVVIDLRSTNGTFVNDERIAPMAPRVLRDGDRVRFGATVAAALRSEDGS